MKLQVCLCGIMTFSTSIACCSFMSEHLLNYITVCNVYILINKLFYDVLTVQCDDNLYVVVMNEWGCGL